MIELTGQVRVRRLTGTINIIPSESGGGGPLQAKTVYPSHSEQVIAPDEDYYGLVSVTVKAVPRVPACEVSVESDVENLVETVVNIGACVSVTAETYYTHFLYNGVRLPRIPDSVLKDYPYCFIRLNSDGSTYDLVLASQIWYYKPYLTNESGDYAWYTANTSSATWTFKQTSPGTVNFGSGGGLVWSNHDIPNGSATSTEIYFAGSEPVPTE